MSLIFNEDLSVVALCLTKFSLIDSCLIVHQQSAVVSRFILQNVF